MTWRKGLVRGLVFTTLGGMVLAFALFRAWTNPGATRRQLLAHFAEVFPGALVSVEEARFRLFGGIAVTDLRMARRDDLEKTDFLYVPSATIYHDKQHLLRGAVGIERIELYRPRLRLVRERNGRFNVSGLCASHGSSERLPTLVVHQGTLLFEDHCLPGNPLLEIHDAEITLVNDPLPTLTVEGTGRTDVVGPLHLTAALHRATGEVAAQVDLTAIPVGPGLVQRLSGPLPDVARHLRLLSGTGEVHARLAYHPSAVQPLVYNISGRLKGGAFSHALLPLPLKDIDARFHCVTGAVRKLDLTAHAGAANVSLTLHELQLPQSAPFALDDLVREIRADVEHLPVTPELLAQLPSFCQDIARDYHPSGPVSLTYTFRRTSPSQWRRQLTFQPEGMSGEYCWFRYPFHHVTGIIDVETNSEDNNRIGLRLNGKAGEAPLSLEGTIQGPAAASALKMTISGDNMLLDDRLFNALPQPSQQIVLQFLPQRSRRQGLKAQPAGLANFKVFLERKAGQPALVPHYHVVLHHCDAEYDLFPYPLENVTGILDFYPDRWSCQGFEGAHKQGKIYVEAASYQAPVAPLLAGQRPPEEQNRVRVEVKGVNLLLDDEFETALSPRGARTRAALQTTWKTMRLRGRLSFHAVVFDRPDQPQDIDVAVRVRGCTMQPQFFPWALDDVSATVHYNRGLVSIRDVEGQHGRATLRVKDALVQLKPGGGFTAWLEQVQGTSLTTDRDFVEALPLPLRGPLERLRLQAPFSVLTDRLVLDTDRPEGLLKVWWWGGLGLRNATAQAGVALSGVDGDIYCTGHYDGNQLQGLIASVLLNRVFVLRQPLSNVSCQLVVRQDYPNVIEVLNLKSNFFGGSLGGMGRIEFGPELRYKLDLIASQVQLEQISRHNLGADVQVSGPARGILKIEGEGDSLASLRGEGGIEVPSGKMYRLPVLLDLIKWLGLRVPDRTAFEQGMVRFALEGARIRLREINLYGSAFSVRGQGTMNLDGSNVNLDFNVDWGRVPGLLPPVLGDLSRAISDQVLKIKMRGDLNRPGSVRFEKEPLPNVVEPIKRVLGSGT